MKKVILSVISLILMLCVITSCGNVSSNKKENDDIEHNDRDNNSDDSNNNSNNNNDNDKPSDNDATENLEKFSGKILKGTPFSEGLAVITDGTKTYCINKNGQIISELGVVFNPNLGGSYTKGYESGLIKIGDSFYDTKGKETKPEDVGVTSFFDIGLEYGYIVAEKEESTYNSTKRWSGIMNTDFEWMVPLSEELYGKLHGSGITVKYTSEYILSKDGNFIFEIATSKFYEYDEMPDVLGEYGWTSYTDGSFRDEEDNIIFTVENGSAKGSWKDGKHLISFYNETARKYYFTLIDTTGKFQFEPIELEMPTTYWGYNWEYDGRYIVVSDAVDDSFVYIYDTVEKTSRVSDEIIVGDIVWSDGIIAAYDIQMSLSSGTRTQVKYYDINFNLLLG